MSNRITVCGRIHLGPVCANGGALQKPMCQACGEYVTRAERDTVQRMWDTVRTVLRKYKRDDA